MSAVPTMSRRRTASAPLQRWKPDAEELAAITPDSLVPRLCLVAAVRALIDQLATSSADDQVLRDVTVLVNRANQLLQEHPHREGYLRAVEGVLTGLGPYRELCAFTSPLHAFAPPIALVARGEGLNRSVTGTVAYGNAYEGPPGHVHGGFIVAAFDEIFAYVQAGSGRMTADLQISYRASVPLHVELQFSARVDRIEGRKAFVEGALTQGEKLCATARALFIAPRLPHMTTETPVPEPRFATGVAIVAGGSGQIGRSICLALAAAGADVLLTYREDRAAAEGVAREIEALGRKAQIAPLSLERADDAVALAKAAVHQYGAIHSVVYAASLARRPERIGSLSPAEWAQVIEADVLGCFNLVHATLPHFRAVGSGAYLAVTSYAVGRMAPGNILSAAPRAAIEMFMRGLAKEEGRNGIRANCLSPGVIAGESAAVADGAPGLATKAIPVRREGSAEEIAEAALFLLSSRATYITGHTLAVDGGIQI